MEYIAFYGELCTITREASKMSRIRESCRNVFIRSQSETCMDERNKRLIETWSGIQHSVIDQSNDQYTLAAKTLDFCHENLSNDKKRSEFSVRILHYCIPSVQLTSRQ